MFSPREQDQPIEEDYDELRTLRKLKSPRESKKLDKCLESSQGEMSPEPDILSDRKSSIQIPCMTKQNKAEFLKNAMNKELLKRIDQVKAQTASQNLQKKQSVAKK